MEQIQRNILVTGMPGSGKSFLTNAWRALGINTVDADDIEGLGDWYDQSGQPVEFDDDVVDEEWLRVNKYLWDESFLRNYLDKQRSIIVLGASNNAIKLKDIFDQVFYLQVPAEVIQERLYNAGRKGVFGSTPLQQEAIVSSVAESDAWMKELGIRMIDGTKSPEEILQLIQLA